MPLIVLEDAVVIAVGQAVARRRSRHHIELLAKPGEGVALPRARSEAGLSLERLQDAVHQLALVLRERAASVRSIASHC